MPLSAVDPVNYDRLLWEKSARVQQLLGAFSLPAADIYASRPTGFRMRAEFRVWHDGDNLDYVMYRAGEPKTPIAIDAFPIACEGIQQLMPRVLAAVKSSETLRRKLFQVEFLSTLTGDTLISLIYHRKLDENWELEALALAQQLSVVIVGRSRKQKVVLERDYVTEMLSVAGTDFTYRQFEQAFTQPNARVNINMIEWACECAGPLTGDLLELYCGNGNFTLPLSQHFDHVVATELSKTSVRAARQNLELNAITNVQMIRLSAEEVTEALLGSRVFRRLEELPKPLAQYALDSVFVDPPRAGLDAHTLQMVTQFDSIIYISCNPETLAENLAHICQTHRVTRFALFDQFPYTHHMECGVLLERIQSI